MNELLASADLTIAAAEAQTVSLKIDQFERMIMTAEARRNATYREVDRHRATLALTAQRAVQEIEDAEFKVVKAETIENKNIAACSSA